MFKKYIDGGRGMSIFWRDQYVNTLVIYGLLHQPIEILRLRYSLAQTLAPETLSLIHQASLFQIELIWFPQLF